MPFSLFLIRLILKAGLPFSMRISKKNLLYLGEGCIYRRSLWCSSELVCLSLVHMVAYFLPAWLEGSDSTNLFRNDYFLSYALADSVKLTLFLHVGLYLHRMVHDTDIIT